MNEQWEYLTVKIPADKGPVQVDEILNRYGAQRWELVQLSEFAADIFFATFKRKIPGRV